MGQEGKKMASKLKAQNSHTKKSTSPAKNNVSELYTLIKSPKLSNWLIFF